MGQVRRKVFEDWLASPRGKEVFSALCTHVKLQNQQYVKNCLWWAYNAGNTHEAQNKKLLTGNKK